MTAAKVILTALAVVLSWPTDGRAWVISDRFSDVFTAADGDFLVTRRVRRNEDMKAEETVWDVFTRTSPGRPMIAFGFQEGALAHRWDLDDVVTYPKKKELRAALETMQAGDGSVKIPEAEFRALLEKKLKLTPVEAQAACGAKLTQEKSGYSLTVAGYARRLGWVHQNADGKPYERTVTRCYSSGKDVLGVIVLMKGTVTSKSESGELTRFPGFSSEKLVWTFERPKL